MDKLAVELLTYISFFACTDGGQTGCALSLVSKRINYASRPARFYSVSLIQSPMQIEQFLSCYQKERMRAADNIPRVRHLCLSLFGKGIKISPSDVPSTPLAQPTSRAEFLASLHRRTQHWKSAQDNMDEQYNRVLPTLIRVVAPDIRSLALMQAQWRSSSVLRCQFPCLEEIALVGGDPRFLPFNFVPEDKPLYPALKRLHHILSHVNRDVDFLQWAQHAPNLTHLRVSRMDYDPRLTVESLEQAIDISAPQNVFPCLEQVVIQPHPGPPPVTRSGTIELVYRDFIAHLGKLADEAQVPVLLLPPMVMPPIAPGADPSRGCILKLRGEWMARIEGREGCWSKPIDEGKGGDCVEH